MSSTNKIKRLLFILIAFVYTSASAQWSVLNDDERIPLNKSEFYLYQSFSPQQWNASNFATVSYL